MTTATATSSPGSPRSVGAAKAILWGGLLCGALDLIFAIVHYGMAAKGMKAMKVLQTIAGGVLGREAYKGGAATAALGVALHFVISFGAAAVFVGAARRVPVLLKRAAPCGMIFGVAVYYVMNMVVLPLSALHTKAFPPPLSWSMISGHALFVGLPIAWAARRFLRVS